MVTMPGCRGADRGEADIQSWLETECVYVPAMVKRQETMRLDSPPIFHQPFSNRFDTSPAGKPGPTNLLELFDPNPLVKKHSD